MGIVNLTPNSFSDGGETFSQGKVKEKILFLWEQGVRLIDVGAESTAPMNEGVSYEEEFDRIETLLFPVLAELNLPLLWLSIDTYRPQTFLKVYQKVKSLSRMMKNVSINLIWNDVSGILDQDVGDILTHHCPDAYYVFSHSGVSARECVSQHMNFVQSHLTDQEFLEKIKIHFQQGYDYLFKRNLLDRVIFDPCFGFAKTENQNRILFNNLADLIKKFSVQNKMKMNWLIGISRKSFLKKMIISSCQNQYQHNHNNDMIIDRLTEREYTERFQTYLLAKLLQETSEERVIFRLHDPSVYWQTKELIKKFPLY